jgi:Zn-dependent protease
VQLHRLKLLLKTVFPATSPEAQAFLSDAECGNIPIDSEPYAKPVPVNFRALRNPRRDMVWVAAAGPATNIVLAVVAALLFYVVDYLPTTAGQWVAENLKNALIINVILAVFDLLPLPPLEGGIIALGLLPDALASPLARLEPTGCSL